MGVVKTSVIVEQHIHGAFGIDFLTCNEYELLDCAKKLLKIGVGVFCPTLATAPVGILRRQIDVISSAIRLQQEKKAGGAKIYGINLEACFIAPEKRGIHDESQLLLPSVENFKLLESENIRLVTLAPELDKNLELTNYLRAKGVKVFAGHTQAHNLRNMDGVTHLFNAMAGISHRRQNTVTSALLNDDLYCELIADGYHIHYDNVKLVLKTKSLNKIILISDALPIAGSEETEMMFCNKKIYLSDGRATDSGGTLAGSSMLLPDIIRKLVKNEILTLEAAVKMAANSANLFDLSLDNQYLLWDDDLNLESVKFAH
ncbi:hypothetical protein IJE86_11365 [bacterium]|nr:hypothetical protein [bacterium]